MKTMRKRYSAEFHWKRSGRPDAGDAARTVSEREEEKLHAKIGLLVVERGIWHSSLFRGGGPAAGGMAPGLRSRSGRRHLAELATVEIGDGFADFGFGVHHEWTISRDWFVNRLAGKDQHGRIPVGVDCRSAAFA